MYTISEKIFLISLHEKRNGSIKFSRSPFLSFGLVAGSLMQIILSRMGSINSSKKLIITNPITEHNLIPGDLLRQIVYEKEYKKSQFWIEAIGRKRKRIEAEFTKSFIDKQVFFFEGQICQFHPNFLSNPTPKFLEKEILRDKVLGKKGIDIESYCVLTLLSDLRILDQVFTYDEIRPVCLKLSQIKKTDLENESNNQNFDELHTILESLNQSISTYKA